MVSAQIVINLFLKARRKLRNRSTRSLAPMSLNLVKFYPNLDDHHRMIKIYVKNDIMLIISLFIGYEKSLVSLQHLRPSLRNQNPNL